VDSDRINYANCLIKLMYRHDGIWHRIKPVERKIGGYHGCSYSSIKSAWKIVAEKIPIFEGNNHWKNDTRFDVLDVGISLLSVVLDRFVDLHDSPGELSDILFKGCKIS
jgi:hypothetical protein